MLEIDNMDIQIMAVPTTIEELSQIRQYMAEVPITIEKKQVDIKKCTDIYDMLNDFQYAFTEEEDADKRWRMFGSPQETV
jgi:translation initiation factor IF-2